MGGTVTGPVLRMSAIGSLLFVVALPMALAVRGRISGAVTLLAALLCLPIYLYFTIPGPFRWLFRGQYSVPLQANVVLQAWPVVGLVALVIAASLGLWGLFGPTQAKPQNS
jgi:hypothetical protein